MFVIDGTILDRRCYAGDPAVVPDDSIVARAIATWTATGRAARGYAIDFGVLDEGATVLVELNDGYSIGAYGLDPTRYVELLIARWHELVARVR